MQGALDQIIQRFKTKLDEHGVTCTKEPRWTAAGWIAWPFAVIPSRPQREGTEGVRLTEIAKASPWKGLPAISVDGAPQFVLAVQWHPEEFHQHGAAPDHGLFDALIREARRGTAVTARTPKERGPAHSAR